MHYIRIPNQQVLRVCLAENCLRSEGRSNATVGADLLKDDKQEKQRQCQSPQQLRYGLAGYDFGDAGPNVSRLTILPAGEKRMQSWPFTVTFPSGRMSTHLNSATS